MTARLLHYSDRPLPNLAALPASTKIKPRGLWVSVEGPDDWKSWCEAEGYGLDRLAYVYEVTLAESANVVWVEGEAAFDAFDREWAIIPGDEWGLGVRWRDLAQIYDGIVIAPYLWSRRLGPLWYYGWDCASGCIWNVAAIAETRLRAVATPAGHGSRNRRLHPCGGQRQARDPGGDMSDPDLHDTIQDYIAGHEFPAAARIEADHMIALAADASAQVVRWVTEVRGASPRALARAMETLAEVLFRDLIADDRLATVFSAALREQIARLPTAQAA
ncbi:MAG: hypothetical protein JOZ27_09525 [Caulobacteraceae bacterium]|nr:hypothetical protein [Caulobacteraceae bacterium]